MTTTRTRAVKAIIYLRLSDFRDHTGRESGDSSNTFDEREQTLRKFAASFGWEVHKVVIENDVNGRTGKIRTASAYKRRKVVLPDGTIAMRVVRPGYREILDHFVAGRANALLAEDLDRTMRDPRDLEDFIDIAAMRKINARSLAGSLTFTDGGTDAEVTMARLMVTIANKSSRDTGRRVAAGRKRQAHAGRFGGGVRPFGFEDDGVTIRRDEADVLLTYSDRLLTINAKTDKPWSQKALAAELRAGTVPSVTGAPWTPAMLRTALLRPRNAGILTYKGTEIGVAPWPEIVPLATFRAVQRLLTDPSRKTGPGPASKWLGSGLYLCGVCRDGATCRVTVAGRAPRYTCLVAHHLTRNVEQLDRYVTDTLLARVSQPGFIEQFVQRPTEPGVDLEALRVEAAGIRVELDGLAQDRVMGRIDRDQMLKGTDVGQARLIEINQILSSFIADSPIAPLVGADDVRTVWKQQPLSAQRAILDTMATVTINRARRGPKTFDPDAIDLVFRDPTSGTAR